MPETMANERKVLLRAFGAQIVLTPGSAGMRGAVDKADEIVANRDAIFARQFGNEANPTIHEATTATRSGRILAARSTLCSRRRNRRHHHRHRPLPQVQNPDIHLVAVEPANSPLLTEGKAGRTRSRASALTWSRFWTVSWSMKC